MLPNATDCNIRAFDACECLPGECQSKAKDLGRFTKVNDVTGVFTPNVRHILVVALGMSFIAASFFVPAHLHQHYADLDLRNQEDVGR